MIWLRADNGSERIVLNVVRCLVLFCIVGNLLAVEPDAGLVEETVVVEVVSSPEIVHDVTVHNEWGGSVMWVTEGGGRPLPAS